MAELNLSKYGISGTTEIVHNPSYEMLFAEETKPGLEGFEKGQVSELGAVNVMTGISKDVSNIVIPLGATMHMDGSAMSAIIKVAFLFGMFGQDFTTGRAILAIIVAVFSSVAMSGIPGGGGTGELVLCSIFFPDHLAVAFPIALALGNLVDPPATMVNSAGDYVVSFIVSRYVDGKDWLQKQLHKDTASAE